MAGIEVAGAPKLSDYAPTSWGISRTGEVYEWPTIQEYCYNTGKIWYTWNDVTSGTGTSCYTDSDTFRIWTTRTTSSATTTGWTINGITEEANTVWNYPTWQFGKHSQARWTPTVHRAPPMASPEEIAARDAERELRRQRRLRQDSRRRRLREAAEHRAQALLQSMLSPEQRAELEEKKHFHLTVYDRDGSYRTYRIERGYAGNVKLLDAAGRPIRRYCIHADSRLPYEDQMLAQKLLLESDEKAFLKIANMTRLRAAA